MKWYNLFNPFAYIRKARYIACKMHQERLRKAYDKAFFVSETRKIYSSFGLDFDAAVIYRDELLTASPSLKLDKRTSCMSEHWTFFAALALAKQAKINRILELGTYNAETTHYLSLLFPSAQIITIDLPDDSPVFINSYGRSEVEYRERFLQYRSALLKRENIQFVQLNSFMLPSLQLSPFDLIWVDAGHDYPEVGWDVCNAYHLLSVDGLMLCDDIYMDSEAPRNMLDSYHVLQALEKYGLCKPNYILKRFDVEWSADPKMRKYIAIIEK